MLTGSLLPSNIPSTTEATAEALNDDKVGVKEAVAGVLENLAMKQLLLARDQCTFCRVPSTPLSWLHCGKSDALEHSKICLEERRLKIKKSFTFELDRYLMFSVFDCLTRSCEKLYVAAIPCALALLAWVGRGKATLMHWYLSMYTLKESSLFF